MTDQIIDQRKGGKYMTDNIYIDKYARYGKWKATLAYNSLCRHANHKRTCFPGLLLMAQQHGCTRQTIAAGLKRLVKLNIIKIVKQPNKGRWTNNDYILLDHSDWKRLPC